ncbi:hypothetical protein V7S43_014516 [Phytophthora oleae]|uniref:Condensation domain-containing protein n=1 Tax=Phytophthora oleae TaxID=2107226 RepID=A0ABD3F0N9_9STRA
MPLGPLDQRSLLAIPLAVIFIYRPTANTVEELIPIQRLGRALSLLLDYYPHLTGRIVINPKDQSPEIQQLGTGAKLVAAHCSLPLNAFEAEIQDDEPGSPARLIGPNLPDGGNALLPPFDLTEEGAAQDAILTVQHTKFPCGGVSIGLRLRHIICDAAGFFQLARDMAELYRGLKTKPSLAPPAIHSYLSDLMLSAEERQENLQIKPTLFDLAPVLHPLAKSETIAPEPVLGRIVRFSSQELSAIKAAAGKDRPVSTFCALAAHLWQSIYQARLQCGSPLPRQFLASVDLRSREQFNVSPRYFPNCVLCPVFSLSDAILRDASLSEVAAAVHDNIQPLDPVKVERNLRWLAAQPDKQRVRLRYRFEEAGVQVSQWSKFGMYRGTELDVPPTLVAQPFTPISLLDGLMYFMATEDQLIQSETSPGVTSGSIDVSLALSEQTWKILDKDVRFRQYRSW